MTKPSEKLESAIFRGLNNVSRNSRALLGDNDNKIASAILKEILSLDPNELCGVKSTTKKSNKSDYDVVVHSVVWKEGV